MVEEIIKEIESVFSAKANSNNALAMKKYMKNKFEFYGIKSVERKEISKPILAMLAEEKKVNESLVKYLWQCPQRELHYMAMEYLFKMKKYWEESHFELFENLITQNSWWDTVDFLASTLVSTMAQKNWQEYKEKIRPWIFSENMWLNRTAIIVQLKYKNEVDTEFLKEAILPHMSSTEFFHRKAIGWALREYSKKNPEWVRTFVQSYPLSNLSKREATKYIL